MNLPLGLAGLVIDRMFKRILSILVLSSRTAVLAGHQTFKFFKPTLQLGDARGFLLHLLIQPLDGRQRHAVGVHSGDVFVVRADVEGALASARLVFMVLDSRLTSQWQRFQTTDHGQRRQ